MTDLVTLAAGDARVDVVPAMGGAVTAFRWRGVDILRPTPAAAIAERNVRAAASFPLVPFSNRIADGMLQFGGRSHTLRRESPAHPHAIHGVGCQRPWRVEACDADRIVMALDYAPESEEPCAWPFALCARQRIDIAEEAGRAVLQMTLGIENVDTRECPFGLGWHPYFPRSASAVLGFRAGGLWETGPTMLPARHVEVPAASAFDPPRALGDTALDNVFTGFEGTARLDDPDRRLHVTVEGDSAARFLVVYVPAGRDFLAIEPVTHITDAFNRHAQGEAGTGARALPPGGSFSCTMRVVAQTPVPA
jgi:aldose 1-epimerase